MGRRIMPSSTNNNNGHHISPSVISLCLLLVVMAAALSITTTLCGVLFKRKSKPPQSSNGSLHDDHNDKPSASENSDATAEEPPEKDASESLEENVLKELPLPPAMQQVATSSDAFPPNLSPSNNINQYIKKSASTRNFKATLSMKMPRRMSLARSITTKKDHKEKKGGGGWKSKQDQDSVWTKTIILGEKCKVPDEEEDDVVVRDGKGRKVTAYHPRSTSLLPNFRQESFLEQTAVPNGPDP